MHTVPSFAMLLAGLVLNAVAAKAQSPPRQIGFGSKAGMTVTVTSARGIDTANAIIVAHMTEADAHAYCSQYVLKDTPRCRQDYQHEYKLAGFIQADCARGTFSTFYGAHFMFVGAHRKDPNEQFDMSPDYDILDLSTGQPLDGSGASGYEYDLEQFKVLCPSRVR